MLPPTSTASAKGWKMPCSTERAMSWGSSSRWPSFRLGETDGLSMDNDFAMGPPQHPRADLHHSEHEEAAAHARTISPPGRFDRSHRKAGEDARTPVAN